MRPLLLPLRARLAAATLLLLACGSDPQPVGPDGLTDAERAEEAALRVCEGVSCTAGYCTNEGATTAVCRCTPIETALGLACEVDEVGDFDMDPRRVPTLSLPVGPTSGRLHARDYDTFAFEAVAGHAYRFTCTPEGFPLCAVQFSSSMGSITDAQELREGASTVVTFQAQSSGRHTVQLAAGPMGSSAQRGTYRYTLAEVADAEGAPTPGAHPVATDGTPFTGRVDYREDVDGFSFEGRAGHVYRARCTGEALAPALMGPGIGLSTVGFTRSGETYESVVELGASGVHLLHVRSYVPQGSAAYACTLEDLGADDHGDAAAEATQLGTLPAQLTGVLETKDDQDLFAFRAQAGHTYDLDCDRATQWVCDFAFIEHERRTLPPSPITVTEDRTLYVRVDGGNRHATGPGRVGPYVLGVRDLGADQGTGAQDAAPLSVGSAVSGTLGFDWESDFFRLEAEPGRVYRVSVDLPSSVSVSVARAAAPTVNLLRYPSTRSGLFKVERAEPVLVEVRGSRSAYTLRLEALAADDHADALDAATPVPAPSLRAEGLLDTVEDVDWFALELQQRSYALRSFQTDHTAVFSLVEADGVTPVPYEWWTGLLKPRSAGRHDLRAYATTPYFDVQNRYLYELSPR